MFKLQFLLRIYFNKQKIAALKNFVQLNIVEVVILK